MYSQDARKFIIKLIRIQRKLYRKGYRRTDQPAVKESIIYLNRYLNYYRYNDEQMKSFFKRNLDRIRILIPHQYYSGYKKLLDEFYNLQNIK